MEQEDPRGFPLSARELTVRSAVTSVDVVTLIEIVAHEGLDIAGDLGCFNSATPASFRRSTATHAALDPGWVADRKRYAILWQERGKLSRSSGDRNPMIRIKGAAACCSQCLARAPLGLVNAKRQEDPDPSIRVLCHRDRIWDCDSRAAKLTRKSPRVNTTGRPGPRARST